MSEVEAIRRRRPLFVWLGAILASLVAIVGILALVVIANNRPPTGISLPAHVVPKDNGWDYFIKAAKTAPHGSPLSDPNGPEKWTMAQYESFAKANEPALKVLREGLTKPGVCPSMRSVGQWPEFARLRELARTLRGEAMYHEKKGDDGRAVNAQLDCVEMGVSIANKGPLIADLVSVAIVAIGIHRIEHSLPKLNEAELARAAARMDEIRKDMPSYGDIVINEGYFGAAEYSKAFSEIKQRRKLMNPLTWSEDNYRLFDDHSKVELFFGNARLAAANKTALIRGYLGYCQDVANEVRGPYTGKINTPTEGNRLAEQFADMHLRGWQSHAECEATIALIEAEIAVRRYKAANGIYPKNLCDLVPAYVKKVPTDPFGGKFLGYRQVNGGKDFTLYSIGQNLSDEGGKPHVRPGAKDTGDIVLGSP